MVVKQSGFLFVCMMVVSVLCKPVVAIGNPADPVGFVIIGKGAVFAKSLNAAAKQRPLKRRSRIFPGDTITTGLQSEVQIKFVDGSIIAVKSDSVLKVDEFEFDHAKGKEKSFFTLIKGGVRAISGKIGKKDPSRYQMKTPLATIGIRGTHYTLAVGNTLSVGVWQGGVSVTNTAGALNLGADASYRFAQVSATDAVPQGLMQPPMQLLNVMGETELQGQVRALESEGQATEQKAESNSPGVKVARVVGADEQAQSSVDAPQRVFGFERQEGNGSNAAVGMQAARVQQNLVNEIRVAREGGTVLEASSEQAVAFERDDFITFPSSCATGTTAQDAQSCEQALLNPEDGSPPLIVNNSNSAVDTFETSAGLPNVPDAEPLVTLTEQANLSRFGLALIDSSQSFGITDEDGNNVFSFGGLATNSSPSVLVDRAQNADASNYLNAPVNWVVRRNSTQAQALSISTPRFVPADISAGVWLGNQTDAVGIWGVGNTQYNVQAPVYWLTVNPTAVDVVASKTGVVEYNIPIFFAGSGSLGSIIDLNMALSVDFDAAPNQFQGVLGFDTDQAGTTHQFKLNVGGQFDQRVLTFNTLTGLLDDTQALDGEMIGFFAGSDAQWISGGFRIWSQANSLQYVVGLYGLGSDDFRLDNTTEESTLSRYGSLAVAGLPTATVSNAYNGYTGVLQGIGSASGANGPIFGVRQAETFLSLELAPLAPVWVVKGVNNSNQSLGLAGFQSNLKPNSVDFGVFDSGDAAADIEVYTDPLEPTAVQALDQRMFWLTADVAPLNAGLTGTLVYETPLFYAGDTDLGSVRYMELAVDIDFDNFTVPAADFEVVSVVSGATPNEHLYEGDLTGSIDGQHLVLDVNSGTSFFEDDQGNRESLFGHFGGILIEGGEVLSGQFKLWTNPASANPHWATGVFGFTHREDRLTAALRFELSSGFVGYATAFAGQGLGLYDPVSGQDEGVFEGRFDSANPTKMGDYWVELDTQGTLDEEPFQYVITHLGAPVLAATPVINHASLIPTDFNVGQWSSANVTEFQYNPMDVADKVSVFETFQWMSALPSSNAALMSKTGSVLYDHFVYVSGQSNQGPLNVPPDLFRSFVEVNFDDFSVGRAEFTFWEGTNMGDPNTWRQWHISSSGGSIDGATLELDPILNGFVCPNSGCGASPTPAYGEVGGVFVGSNGNTIGGAFKLWQADDLTQWISGVYAITQETRLTSPEVILLNTVDWGFISIGGTTTYGFDDYANPGQDIGVFQGYFGRTINAGALTDLFFKEDRVYPWGLVMREGAFGLSASGTEVLGSERVDWGQWQADSGNPVLAYTDLTNPTVPTNVTDPVYWIVAKPTDPQVVHSLTGNVLYGTANVIGDINGTPIDFIGSGTLINVDFGAMTFSGALDLMASTDILSVAFSGDISDSMLDVTGITADINAVMLEEKFMQAHFAGDAAQAIAGGWKLYKTDLSQSSAGVFLLKQ